jgi:hypothetical protein
MIGLMIVFRNSVPNPNNVSVMFVLPYDPKWIITMTVRIHYGYRSVGSGVMSMARAVTFYLVREMSVSHKSVNPSPNNGAVMFMIAVVTVSRFTASLMPMRHIDVDNGSVIVVVVMIMWVRVSRMRSMRIGGAQSVAEMLMCITISIGPVGRMRVEIVVGA